MPATGWKMQHVAGLRDPLLISDDKTHATSLHYRDFPVRRSVSRRVDNGIKVQGADHQLVSDNHLPFDAFRYSFLGDTLPVTMPKRSGKGGYLFHGELPCRSRSFESRSACRVFGLNVDDPELSIFAF